MDNQQQQQQHNHSRHLSLQQNDITNTTNTTNTTTTTSNTTKNNARNNIKNSNINKNSPNVSSPHHNEQSLNNNTNNTNSNNNNTNYPNYEQLYLPESNSTNNFFQQMDNQSPNFMDQNWTPHMLPQTASYLANLDLPNIPTTHSNNHYNNNNNSGSNPSYNTSSIMQTIQNQHNVHDDQENQQQQQHHQYINLNSPSSSSHQVTPNPPISSSSSSSKSNKQKRPCDQCRKRKIKCVLVPNTNNCVQCEAKQVTCTYTDQAPKRKLAETTTPANNDQLLKRGRIMDTSLLSNGSTIVPPDVAIREVSPIQDYSAMNNSLLKRTLSLQFPRSSFYVGPTSSVFDINLLNSIIKSHEHQMANGNESTITARNNTSNNKIEQVSLNNSVSLRKVSDTVQFILKEDQSPQSYQTMSNDVDTIEKFISPHGQILVDLYFRIIHPSYPIIHKKVFIEKYSRTHREFSAPLLAAVYVLAIQWWDYDPQLNRFPKPNVEMILKIGLNNYMLEILKRPKLSAVQAGLLLLQCKHIINCKSSNDGLRQQGGGSSNSNHSNSVATGDADYSEWILCSQIVSLAEELGLGLDCNDWKLPKWERGLRKRLAWAVYLEDKWLSLKLARPSHINESNWMVLPLYDQDFPEKHGDGDLKEGSSDIDNGKKIFIHLIELSKILSDILNQFYSMKAMKEITEIDQVLKLAKPLQLRLRDWFRSLPIELQMSSVQPRKLCSNGFLQLAYFATELTLHRKITTIIFNQTKAGNPPSPELVGVCRSAAKTRLMASIEFVRDLKQEHIHSFWHCSATSNFTLIGTFAAILLMSSSTKEETDFYRDQILNYRWILKISSKGFDQAAEALADLDLVLTNIPGLIYDNINVPSLLPNVLDSLSLIQHFQMSHSPAGASPPQNSTSTITTTTTATATTQQRIRAPIRESPLSSPQNMYTPPLNNNNNSNVGNSNKGSPMSNAQGLSPKNKNMSGTTPKSPVKSPELTK